MREKVEFINEIEGYINQLGNQTLVIDHIKKCRNLPHRVIKKCIKDGDLKINGKVVKDPNYSLNKGDDIIFRNEKTKKYITKSLSGNDLSSFIIDNFRSGEDFKTLPAKHHKLVFALIILFVQKYGYDHIANCDHNLSYRDLLKRIYKQSGLSKVIGDQKLRDRALINKLINLKNEVEQEFDILLINVQTRSIKPQELLQKYNTLIRLKEYDYLLNPFISEVYSNTNTVKTLVQPYFDLEKTKLIKEKYQCFEDNRGNYTHYIETLNSFSNHFYITKFYKPLASSLLEWFKTECDIKEEKKGRIDIIGKNRKYNFRSNINNSLNLNFESRNVGEGVAQEVNCEIIEDEIFSDSTRIELGIFQSNERRDFNLKPLLKKDPGESTFLKLELNWKNLNGESNSTEKRIEIFAQSENTDWDKLENDSEIYAIRQIKDKTKLFGRDEILIRLKKNAKSKFHESYKIFGQKRVGKSSIVLTLKTLLKEKENIIVPYVVSTRNVDPVATLNELGDELCYQVRLEIQNSNLKNKKELLSVEHLEFKGSLKPLIRYLKELSNKDDRLNFIFIIDEFDTLNEEFFLPGNFGRTISTSIGKVLHGLENVGVIVVGSENMELLKYQDQNYNDYRNIEVDTFNINTQYEDYKDIIETPVEGEITYSEASIKKIHSVTNGNPYFTNLICREILRYCIKIKDSEVHQNDANRAIRQLIETSAKAPFAHFWEDGILDDTQAKREKISDIRRRILVSYRNFYKINNGNYPSKSEILRGFKIPDNYEINKEEIENVLDSFFVRNIFIKQKTVIRIIPGLFEEWLCDGIGGSLITTGVSDLQAQERSLKLDLSHKIADDELNRLQINYNLGKRQINLVELRSFFNRFGNHSDQRIIFNLFDNIFFIKDQDITDFINSNKKLLFGSDEIFLKSGVRNFVRDGIEIFSSSKFFEQNIPYYETFKKLSSIRSNVQLKKLDSDRESWKRKKSKTIIILESIILKVDDIKDELLNFLVNVGEYKNQPSIRFFTFIITKKALRELSALTKDIGLNNIIFVKIHELESNEIKPFVDDSLVYSTIDERLKGSAVCRKFNDNTNDDNVLVLFEKFCPVQTVPIFWEKREHFDPIFPNEFKIGNANTKQLKKLERKTYNDTPKTELKADTAAKLQDLDNKVSEIERWLRNLIIVILKSNKNNSMTKLSHLTNDIALKQKLEERIDKELSKSPFSEKKDLLVPEKALEFSDLQELSKIITNGDHYRYFEEIFRNKDNFSKKFESLSNFRIAKRHDRKISEITLMEGEAAITWFLKIKEKYENPQNPIY